MFYKCSSLIELNFPGFKINDVTDINYMFLKCSDILIKKIEKQIKSINN